MKKNKIHTKDIISVLLSVAGYTWLFVVAGWKMCVIIFLIIIGNNLDEKSKRMDEDNDHRKLI